MPGCQGAPPGGERALLGNWQLDTQADQMDRQTAMFPDPFRGRLYPSHPGLSWKRQLFYPWDLASGCRHSQVTVPCSDPLHWDRSAPAVSQAEHLQQGRASGLVLGGGWRGEVEDSLLKPW